MMSLDTNVVARWMIRDVPEQAAVVDQLLENGELAFVEDIVFFELEHLLRSHYQMTRDLIVAHLWSVIDSRWFEANKTLWRAVLVDFEANHSLSLADCHLAHAAAIKGREPLMTFDKTLAKKLPKTVKLLG